MFISLVGRLTLLVIMAGIIQRTAWSSLVHVMRQSTELVIFMFFYVEKVIYGP